MAFCIALTFWILTFITRAIRDSDSNTVATEADVQPEASGKMNKPPAVDVGVKVTVGGETSQKRCPADFTDMDEKEKEECRNLLHLDAFEEILSDDGYDRLVQLADKMKNCRCIKDLPPRHVEIMREYRGFPEDTGTYCAAWDDNDCDGHPCGKKPENAPKWWNESAGCAEHWCYPYEENTEKPCEVWRFCCNAWCWVPKECELPDAYPNSIPDPQTGEYAPIKWSQLACMNHPLNLNSEPARGAIPPKHRPSACPSWEASWGQEGLSKREI